LFASVIDQVAANLAASPQAAIATLAEPIDDVQALFQRGQGGQR
jgi:3-deoxy-manno-octulosonate cytidylyltransferase (CMP-KDO synthetase)